MYIKLFLPVLFLAFIQLLGFYFYSGFSYKPNFEIQCLVSLFYISLITTIVICFLPFRKKINFSNYKKDIVNYKFDFIVLIVLCFTVIKPTILIFFIGMEFGFDYVRQNFFTSDIIRAVAFGNITIAMLTQSYVVPFLWFYCLLIIGSENKKRILFFYILLISLILFNLSYAGRFYIYFAIIVLYLKVVIEGKGVIHFFKKYSLILIVFLFLSMFIINLRVNEDGIASDSNDFIMLAEYHLLQPYFLSQKIENKEIVFDGYPFRVIIEGILSPIFYFFGTKLQDIPQGYFPLIFNNFTLYSNYTGTYYNAFATFFPFVYSDFGMLSPFFVFIIISYFILSSLLISNYILRIKFLAFIALMLYFSLFQSTIFSFGCLMIIVLFPVFSFFYSRIVSK